MIAKDVLVAVLLCVTAASSSYVQIDIEQGNLDEESTFYKRGHEPTNFNYKPIHRKIFQGLSPSSKLVARSEQNSEIVLNNYQNYRYYANISLGTPPQNVTVAVDTGSADLWIYAPNNPFCKPTKKSKNSKRSTEESTSASDKEFKQDAYENPKKRHSKSSGKNKLDTGIKKRLVKLQDKWKENVDSNKKIAKQLKVGDASPTSTVSTRRNNAKFAKQGKDASTSAQTSYTVIRPEISSVSGFEETVVNEASVYSTAKTSYSVIRPVITATNTANHNSVSTATYQKNDGEEQDITGISDSEDNTTDSEDDATDGENDATDSENNPADSEDDTTDSEDDTTDSEDDTTDSEDDATEEEIGISDDEDSATSSVIASDASTVTKSKATGLLKQVEKSTIGKASTTMQSSSATARRTTTASYNSNDEYLSTFTIPVSVSDYTDTHIPSPTATLSCDSFQFYDSSASNSAKKLNNKFMNWYYADEFVYGDVMNDTLAIGDYSISNYTFGVATSGNSTESILGIGLGSNENIGYTYNNLLYRLAEQGDIERLVYSLYLNEEDATHGSLLLGAVDTEKFEGNLTLLPLVDMFNFYVTTTGASLVSSGNKLATNSNIAVISDVKHAAIFDSGAPSLALPETMFHNVIGAIPGVTYIDSAGTIIGKCESLKDISLNISLAGQPFVVSLDSLSWPLSSYKGFYLTDLPPVLNSTEYCMLPFTNSYNDQIILGDPIMRQMYIFYDLQFLRLGVAKAKFASNSSNIVPVVDVYPERALKAPAYEDYYEHVEQDTSLNLSVASGYSKLGLNISKDYDTIIALVGEDTSYPGYWKVGAVFAAVALGDLIIVLIMMM